MKRKMVYIGISYIIGMFFVSFVRADMQIPFMLMVLLVSAFFFKKNQKKFVYFAVSALFFVTGVVSYTLYNSFVYERITGFEGERISYSGKVTEIKKYSGDKVLYRLTGRINSEIRADIICFGKDYGCDYYDTLSFSCVPEVFENDFLFDEKNYYESSGCFLNAEKISDLKLEKDSSFSLVRLVYHYRDYTDEKISSVLPGENGALITAMLLGNKNGLEDDTKKILNRCGTGHMMAVSGMHLVLVTSMISGALRNLKISGKKRFLITELAVVLFTVFSGMSVSVIRAAFMITLIFGADFFSRRSDPLSSLSTAAMLMLAFRPYLIQNASFLLSVAGTYGAAVFAPYITRNMKSEGFISRLKIKLTSVFCISVCVFPFSVAFFDEISLISPVSDILLIPLCTFSLVCGMITAVCGCADIIAYPVLMAGGLAAKLVFRISSFLAGTRFSAISLGRDYIPLLTVFLVLFVVFTAARYKKEKYTLFSVILASFVFFVSSAVYSFMNRDVLSVYKVGSSRAAAVVAVMGRNVDIIDITGNAKSSEYVSKLADICGIRAVNTVSFMKNPYQSMAAFSERLALNSVGRVYVPENTYTGYDVGICGCEPEFFDKNGVFLDNGAYTIEAGTDGAVRISYKGRTISCTVSEVSFDGMVYRDQNISVRESSEGCIDVYKLG